MKRIIILTVIIFCLLCNFFIFAGYDTNFDLCNGKTIWVGTNAGDVSVIPVKGNNCSVSKVLFYGHAMKAGIQLKVVAGNNNHYPIAYLPVTSTKFNYLYPLLIKGFSDNSIVRIGIIKSTNEIDFIELVK